MAFKLINATEVKDGAALVIEGNPCTVKSVDISKTGKHGASKVRIEALGILDNKKRVVVVPGHERFEVPLIKKSKGQILNIQGNKASIMDLESFETLEVNIDQGVLGTVKEQDNVEYWDIDGQKIIKRKI